MNLIFTLSAFIAGVLTFLAPCTLPLTPAYLGFISGMSADDLQDPKKAKSAKRKIFLNGVFFVLGFSVVFIIFGTLSGLLGTALASSRIWLTRIGGVFVITEKRLKIPAALQSKRGKSITSFILGGSFAIGWTPCVGPILGSILLLASTSVTALQGVLLLSIFSLGLAIPFLLLAAGMGFISKYIKHLTRYLHLVTIIGGIFLIFLGTLLVTNKFTLLISWGFRLFEFINYEGLLKFL